MTSGTPLFARTKIQRPRLRLEQIARPPLERRLERALGEYSLVLLCAPAGYGKTVLLSRVLSEPRHGHAVAWVNADTDDDLERLIRALTAALEPYDLPWRVSPEALGTPAVDNPRLAADTLLDTLACSEVKRGIIVLEDAHRLSDGVIFDWLDKVVEGLPPTWCLAITSRVAPPLSLARLRVKNELAEFLAEDLRFSLDEALTLAENHGDCAPQTTDQLWQRTQGWPVGIHLAIHTGHVSQAAWRADRHAFDYLASEVLEQLPPPLQRFLLQCAILPELTAARCAAVSGDPQARVHLDEIERRGLFVTRLEDSERTLRLHDLFRDFLEEQLHHRYSDELPRLLQRAAASEANPIRRIGYLVRAGEWEGAQHELANATPALLLNGAGSQVLRLLDLFPAALRQESPLLSFVFGLYAWPYFDWEPMRDAMKRAADGFSAQGSATQAQQARTFEAMALLNLGRLEEAGKLIDEIHAHPADHEIRVFLELLRYWYTGANGPADAPGRHLACMLELLEESGSPELWYRCIPHFLFLGRPGVNAQIAHYAEQALLIAAEVHPHLHGSAIALKAWLLLCDGRVDEAESLIHEVQEEERWLGRSNNLRVVIAGLLGTLYALKGDREGIINAQIMLAELDRHAVSQGTWRGVYLYHFSRWHLASDNRKALESIADTLRALPQRHEWPFMRMARTGLEALCALHQGNYRKCEALLEPVLPHIDTCDMFAAGDTLRITYSLALARQGQYRDAWKSLSPVLANANRAGGKFGILMVGKSLLGELLAVPWPEDVPVAEYTLLESFAKLSADLCASTRPTNPNKTIEIISARECEVLELLAAGDSNKVIARALDLSPHTVKRHVANILNKLDLATRGQAAAWWHARQQA